MSRKLTIITEVATGLGMIPSFSLADLGGAQPSVLEGVDASTWTELQGWWDAGLDRVAFESSFEHGRYFLRCSAGLRGRPPTSVEWKGPHVPPEEAPIPADLRIDHVYIVSCKNLSKVLANPSPASLFKTALRDHDVAGSDWYAAIAPVEYRALLASATSHLGIVGYPSDPTKLSRLQRNELKQRMTRAWPTAMAADVAVFIEAVSDRSAAALRSVLGTKHEQERFYWRLLRLHSSPYFILGQQASGPMRLMVLTPWDMRRRYEFHGLEVFPDMVGQPQVRWEASFTEQSSGRRCVTKGHFEIRWSHGKFCGAPEAKVYLDTPHAEACGYVPI